MMLRQWVNASTGPVRAMRQRFVSVHRAASVELAEAGDPEARAVLEEDLEPGLWDDIFAYWLEERGHLAR